MMSEKKSDVTKEGDDQQTHRGYNEKTQVKPQGTFVPDSDNEAPEEKPSSNKSQIPGGKPGDDVG